MITVHLPPAPLDFTRTDGGLPLWPGAQHAVVVSAPDALGWTYHHHPDLACWKGRLYVAWNACERDEDTWPSRELFATSVDGVHWSPPQELFPQGQSIPLRISFFLAPNGRMLALAGKRESLAPTREDAKGPLLVREITAEHALGPVYTLRPEGNFSQAPDVGFVAACHALLADRLFLAQQDYGRLLDVPEPFTTAKALCFFQRADGALVALGKKRWAALSHDGGQSWSPPCPPPTLITNMGKVWAQRLPNGRFLLAYNPHEHYRYPLALLTSEEGVHFSGMYAAHEALPPRRFEGLHKSLGASYVRGLSPWSSDGSLPADGVWLVYTVHKEEVRVVWLPLTTA